MDSSGRLLPLELYSLYTLRRTHGSGLGAGHD